MTNLTAKQLHDYSALCPRERTGHPFGFYLFYDPDHESAMCAVCGYSEQLEKKVIDALNEDDGVQRRSRNILEILQEEDYMEDFITAPTSPNKKEAAEKLAEIETLSAKLDEHISEAIGAEQYKPLNDEPRDNYANILKGIGMKLAVAEDNYKTKHSL